MMSADYDNLWRLAERVYRSSLRPRDAQSPEDVFTIMAAGAELGFGPMTSLRVVRTMHQQISLDAAAQLGLALKAGVRASWVEATPARCVLELVRGESVHREAWTMDRAKQAGIAGGTVWRRYPMEMLQSRCITSAIRRFAPDVLGGALYSPDELAGIETKQPAPQHQAEQLEQDPVEAAVAYLRKTGELDAVLEEFGPCDEWPLLDEVRAWLQARRAGAADEDLETE